MSDLKTFDNALEDYLSSTQIDNAAVAYLMNTEGIPTARKLNQDNPDDVLEIKRIISYSIEQDIPFSSTQVLYLGVGSLGDVLICYTPSIDRAVIV